MTPPKQMSATPSRNGQRRGEETRAVDGGAVKPGGDGGEAQEAQQGSGRAG